MRSSTLAVVTGLVLALGPAASASAATPWAGDTGNGLAHGNCRNSSTGGVHDPLPGGAGNGMGGHQGELCFVDEPPVPST